ncbi:MAG: hypothetical protein LQ347_000981 [Umbilicaria vellea]|nr:MAG: hypothetical protein LQ347_000981 [Umbilicaria vellea]
MQYQEENDAHTKEHAERLDAQDPLTQLRNEFIIPTKSDLKRKTLTKTSNDDISEEPCIYLCGNSLGLQPRRTVDRVNSHLLAWATKGVLGHFTVHEDSSLPAFLHVDDVAAEQMAPIVGASRSEVAIMETLTANLHFLMASFYRPTKEKYQIILEGKAFPSDHYAVESQVRHHGLDPASAMILITPSPGSSTPTTSEVLQTVETHAATTALIMLPGIQYYTGQYLDIKTITAYAHSKGILIGWDLAHAVGNIDVQLHDWNVDFAAWCNYKYLNAGPGAIGGLFVHSMHGQVDMDAESRGERGFQPRLSGWWGGDKATRFNMDNHFVPIPGAAGYQVGNPSALALTALTASLEVFAMTSMSAIRTKSLSLTSYLEYLLLLESFPVSSSSAPSSTSKALASELPYSIITPSSPDERGAQLSIKLLPGLLEGVMAELEEQGVVVDERQPDVVRVAPAPLYNTHGEVWEFVKILREACERVRGGKVTGRGSVMVEGGKSEKGGWSEIK